MKKLPKMLYMLIDITDVPATKVLKVATLKRVQLLGAILQAQGRKVLAPPLEGRGFSKLEKLQLQYLYWNTVQETPPEAYDDLIKQCLAKIQVLFPEDLTPEVELERELNKLRPSDDPNYVPKERKAKEPGDNSARPKSNTTTGLVWEIADRMFVEAGNTIPDRKAFIEACVSEEINPATASTQFGKWKKDKEASK